MTHPPQKCIAVIADGALLTLDEKTRTLKRAPVLQDVRTSSQVLDLAHDFQLDSVWILPGSQLSWLAGNYDECFPASGEGYDGRTSFQRSKLACMHLWHTAGSSDYRRTISVHFPEHDPRWGWQNIRSAPDLLYAILYLRVALGCEIEWGPGSTGKSLMEKLNEGPRASWVRESDLSMLPLRAYAQDLEWKSLPDELPEGPLYFHAYDKNSMYLGSCTSANLGEGTPSYLKQPSFAPLCPGLWGIHLAHDTPYYPAGRHWLWTPELEFLVRTETGPVSGLVIEDAFLWEKYHQTLRSWGERLWKARQELKIGHFRYPEAGEHAYSAVKRIATQSLGWLAHKPAEGTSQWYRPDWWNMVVSNARAKMMYKCWGLQQRGYAPCWINVDELGFLSSEKDPAQAVPGLMQRADQLGGFKHAYTLSATPELLELLREADFEECHTWLLTMEKKDGEDAR